MLQKDKITIRQIQNLIGYMVAFFPAFTVDQFYYRELKKEKKANILLRCIISYGSEIPQSVEA